MTSPRAWLVWIVGIFAYLVAVSERTSFGVVGLEARFGLHERVEVVIDPLQNGSHGAEVVREQLAAFAQLREPASR